MTGQELDRFRRVEAVFDAVVEYPPGPERDAFLKDECAADAAMLEEVRRLLEDHERVRTAAPAPAESLPQFGAWRAIRLLGRGGMGTVYLAERSDGAFRMSAAVKVVPLALASVDIEERFRRERQFLASLDHPKVARLIDGGVTQSGLPYLVMEFVDGLTIERYCEAQKLDVRARIALMRQVLEALIYVHGRGVMHRDLKPSNILVDAQGNAKLLDFGTARFLDASGDTAITKTGVFAFTPECASPEQVQGKALTFASDIYSAGVLLYRLLTGRPPYSFSDYSPAAIADRISHTEPEPSGLDAQLDAVLSTALDKNPQKRYASAAMMDADLARYLEGQPVRARRPRRLPKMAMAFAAIVLCAAVAWFAASRLDVNRQTSIAVLPFTSPPSSAPAGYVTSGLADELTEALSRDKKLRIIATASVAQFIGKKVDAREAGRMLQVANVLQGTVEQTGDRLKVTARLERVADGAILWSDTYDRPALDLFAVQSAMAATIAGSLDVRSHAATGHVPNPEAHDLVMKGRYEMQRMSTEALDRAAADFQRAIELDPQYALAYMDLSVEVYNYAVARGSTFRTEEERKRSEELLRQALAIEPDMPIAHGMLALMAMQYDWDWDKAEKELRLGEEGPPTANIESAYAFMLLFRGRFAEADKHIARLQEIDPFEPQVLLNISEVRLLEGRVGEARALAQKVLAGNPKAHTARALLAACDIWEGHTDLALQEIQEWKKSFPPAQMYEAIAHAQAGHRDEALRLIRPFEEKYPNPGVAMQWFALVYALLGDEPNTVKWLGRSADLHEWQVLNIGVSPLYGSMRNSPGFRALEKRIGVLK
jgi:serine/threonine protein kinase/tetratricopeptide (TPR) repeat protein